MSPTNALTQELAAIAEAVRRSTVSITAEQRQQRRSRGRSERRSGIGSGIIWSADGVIITNAHVMQTDSAQVELADGRTFAATVTARNPQRDLAMLQVEGTDLPAATLAETDTLRVGELVLAVGNPLGLPGSVTMGIVSATGSSHSRHWIQTDLQLAPGNSGGPLTDVAGRVLGINTMIVGGRGFAIPTQVVQQFLQQPSAPRPFLGVTLQPVQVRRDRGRSFGLLITDVAANSPAAAADLRLGDVVLGLRGRGFQHPGELFRTLDYSQVGDGLPLWVLRRSQQIQVDVVLWSRDSETKAA